MITLNQLQHQNGGKEDKKISRTRENNAGPYIKTVLKKINRKVHGTR